MRLITLALALSAALTISAQTSPAAMLQQDTALQDAAIIAMRSALGARQQTTVVRRGSFIQEMRIYVETYRGIRDATTLANIQARYNAAKSELLEPRLPDSIAELVQILEAL